MLHKRKKISIIGAGFVGSTAAHWCLSKELGDIVLLDIQGDIAKGRALDLYEASPAGPFDVKAIGTSHYGDIKNSDLIIITAGLARKPGMSRGDLISKNSVIVQNICKEVKKEAPESIVIVVSNPLDVMAYVAKKTLGFPRERVIGMAGVLDAARFKSFIAEKAQVSVKDISAFVLGGHGDTMVPMTRYTSIGGVPLNEILSQKDIDTLIERTKNGGAEIVGLLKTGSAYYAPSLSAVIMAEAILKDQRRILPCSAYLEGEYGVKGLFLGVLCKLSGNGLDKVIELKLEKKEKEALDSSVQAVRNLVQALNL